MFDNLCKSKLEKKFLKYSKENKKTIALPEAEFSGVIIKAAEVCQKKGLADIVLIGNENKIKNTFLYANFTGIKFIDPKNYEGINKLTKELFEIRKNKGLTIEEAKKLILNPVYFALMLLETGVVDGVVGGAATSSAEILKPALQIIPKEKGIETVSSSLIMLSKKNKKLGDKGIMVLGDAAININPNAKQLADIANATIETAKMLAELEPRVAMLSYSTHGSGKGESVDKVKQATKLVKKSNPDLLIEGELQADSAILPKVARVKVHNNEWKGNANVLIFPDLNSGNIAYKLMKTAGKLKAIGPIVQGLEKPVNDLSRGSSLKEIILVIAITTVQANKYDEIEKAKNLEIERLAKEAEIARLKQEKIDAKLARKQAKKQGKIKEDDIIKQDNTEA